MSRERPPSVNPVVMVTLGILSGAAAFALILFLLNLQATGLGSDSSTGGKITLAFITGLTTGGLSCLAMQGGLLASSLARQVEQDYVELAAQNNKKFQRTSQRSNTALPILLFLIAKLMAYTLLGALLGWLGSYLTLSPAIRAFLMIAIGIFMVGNALRMFKLHPIFRYFSIEPPKLITRYIRRTAKGTDTFTPIFLGALTVFIPCGVTQAMMATALGTGSAILGAALMFAFTLGTSPVFFMIAYFTTELGARLEKYFMRFVAVVLLILGFVTLDGALNVFGSPLSFSNLTRGFLPVNSGSAPAVVSQEAFSPEGEIILSVENSGYFPQIISASANKNLVLNLVTYQTVACTRAFLIPELDVYEVLPHTGTVQVSIPSQPAGTKLFFTCSMGMYGGQIVFE